MKFESKKEILFMDTLTNGSECFFGVSSFENEGKPVENH